MRGADVGNVETFHDAWRVGQLQRVGECAHVRLGIDRARKRTARETTCRARGAPQILQHVAQLRRFFKIELSRLITHLLFQLRDHFPRMSLEELTSLRHALTINRRRNLT